MAGLGIDQGHTVGYSESPEPAERGCVELEVKEEAEHSCRGLFPGPPTAYPCLSIRVLGRVKASMGTVLGASRSRESY